MTKPCVKIDNWAVMQGPSLLAFDELRPGTVLVGNVSGDKRFNESELVFTSQVVDVQDEGHLVETRNTLYKLGTVSDEYKDWNWNRPSSAA